MNSSISFEGLPTVPPRPVSQAHPGGMLPPPGQMTRLWPYELARLLEHLGVVVVLAGLGVDLEAVAVVADVGAADDETGVGEHLLDLGRRVLAVARELDADEADPGHVLQRLLEANLADVLVDRVELERDLRLVLAAAAEHAAAAGERHRGADAAERLEERPSGNVHFGVSFRIRTRSPCGCTASRTRSPRRRRRTASSSTS